jgi:hypothetical protein
MRPNALAAYTEQYDGTILILQAWEALEAQRDSLKEQQMTDAKLFDVTAQFAHFFVAAFLVSQVARLPHGTLIGVVGMLLFAAIKEGIYDPRAESASQRGSGWLDFSMYAAGTLVGALVKWL